MITVGDKVKVYGQGNDIYEVQDVAYMDNTYKYSSQKNGVLMVELGLGWIPFEDCEVVEVKGVKVSDVVEVNEDTIFNVEDLDPHWLDTLCWRDGLEPLPDNSNLPPIVTLLMAIQYDKEKYYGSSWKGKGEYRGIMSNIDRKYDRLDKMTQDEIEGAVATLSLIEDHLETGRWTEEDVQEGKIDAIADLTNYGLLYMTYVREHFPRVFNVWVKKNVPPYLAEKIPFLQK